MGHIITVHSFRRGVGKSNTTANVATLLAAAGQRVGVVDTNTQSPSLHILFNLDEAKVVYWLNDYLDSKCTIAQAAHNITKQLNTYVKGEIFLVPANPDTSSITKLLREGYDSSLLVAGFYEMIEDLALDTLILDTGAGLDEDTLPAIAVADTLAILLRHDQRDYQGTSVIVEVARKLTVAHILLIINEVPSTLDLTDV
ncbi:MAG: MinD/ParA family protein, partial [Chloroflexota bacterium]